MTHMKMLVANLVKVNEIFLTVGTAFTDRLHMMGMQCCSVE